MSRLPSVEVIHQAKDFIIVNKPDGISVQNEAGAEGLLGGLRKQLQVEHLYLVHRLDKVTSGLLILALNSAAAARLSGYFADRTINKFYLAITDKKPKKSQGTVSGDMYKIRDGKWALQKSQKNPAISQFFNLGTGHGKRLVIIKPLSGKTHQIRVMLKSLGAPILGDRLYSGIESDRVYLHAYALSFNDQGEHITVTCLPQNGSWFDTDEFKQGLQHYAQPWQLSWPNHCVKSKDAAPQENHR